MKIYLGSDHSGHHLMEAVFAYLSKHTYEVEEIGGKELDPEDDFPEVAQAAALKVIGDSDPNARAILLCGSGQGMAMAANRFSGIRAAVVWDTTVAKVTRNDNDSNILCLPARLLETEDPAVWKDIIDVWLKTPFAAAARYIRRNRQIDEIA